MAKAFAFDFLAHPDGRLELILHLGDGNGTQEVAWRRHFASQNEALNEARQMGLVLEQHLESGCWALGPADSGE